MKAAGLSIAVVAIGLVAPLRGGITTLNPTFDAQGRSITAGNIDKTYTGNLAVGPVSSTDYFRSYLTFDLTSASNAVDVTLTLDGSSISNEGNTSTTPQVFTLFKLDTDWDGASHPGPLGTNLATTDLTITSGDDTQDIQFNSTALTEAFNTAVGGSLYLGIMSDQEGAATRSFKWIASVEDSGQEPQLTFFVPRTGITELTEEFESSSAGSGTPPAGWVLIETAPTATYVTSGSGAGSDGAGGSSGLAGQASSTASPAPGNNGLPGAYLVNDAVLNLDSAISGTFDFQLINEAGFDDVGFIIGDVADGITGTSDGELLYVRITEGESNTTAIILQDGTADGVNGIVTSESGTILDDTWYRATFDWIPTSGTTGGFTFTINDFSSNILTISTSGFTFDSANGFIGFGSINDTISFDNVSCVRVTPSSSGTVFKFR